MTPEGGEGSVRSALGPKGVGRTILRSEPGQSPILPRRAGREPPEPKKRTRGPPRCEGPLVQERESIQQEDLFELGRKPSQAGGPEPTRVTTCAGVGCRPRPGRVGVAAGSLVCGGMRAGCGTSLAGAVERSSQAGCDYADSRSVLGFDFVVAFLRGRPPFGRFAERPFWKFSQSVLENRRTSPPQHVQ